MSLFAEGAGLQGQIFGGQITNSEIMSEVEARHSLTMLSIFKGSDIKWSVFRF